MGNQNKTELILEHGLFFGRKQIEHGINGILTKKEYEKIKEYFYQERPGYINNNILDGYRQLSC